MIVPGILENKIDEVIRKIKLVEPDTQQIQIDIADGRLVDGKTFTDVKELQKIETDVDLEIHLMVRGSHEYVNDLPKNIHYVCAQIEDSENINDFIEAARAKGFIVGLSLAPDTPISKIDEYIERIDYVQFMTVEPGAQGRGFESGVLDKISRFREKYPNKTTQVDGHIDEKTLGLVDELGVDKKVIGTAIYGNKNPEQAENTLAEMEAEQHKVIVPKKKTYRIGFLGGASYHPDDETFKEAYEVAKTLAQQGFEVVNGGGPGVMRASSLGAKAGGQGEVMVVTYHPNHKHKNYEGNDPNNPYDEEILTLDYFDRTKVMLQNTDIHIVFRGGTGTISEFGMTWASSRIHEGHHKPIILYGDFWHKIIETFKQNMMMRPGEVELLKVCTTPQEVLDYIHNITSNNKHEEKVTNEEEKHGHQ